MTRETKSYELKIYDQSLMRFEAAYDAFGSLKLEITDIDSANAHLLPLNLIVDQDEKSLASWMEGRTIPKNRAFVEQILSTAGLTRNDILGILDVSKGLSINDSYWLDDGKSDVTFDGINLFANRYIDVMPEVAEAVAKPLTAVDSIKMYGDGNATKLVRDTTGMVDQVTSGLKDATGIDLTELLSSFHQPFQPREDNE